MGLGREIKEILLSHPQNHFIECPACGDSFKNQALYEEHYYQNHSDRRFNGE